MNNSHVDVNMWHNRFSENENKAVGAPIHDTAIPRHRDSKAKKPRHRETETINPRHCDSKTFFQRTKSHDIEIPRPKNHGIEIPRPKSQDIGFPRNSDPSCPLIQEAGTYTGIQHQQFSVPVYTTVVHSAVFTGPAYFS